jgi:hypothetical protein
MTFVNYAYQKRWARPMIARPPTRARVPMPAPVLVLGSEVGCTGYWMARTMLTIADVGFWVIVKLGAAEIVGVVNGLLVFGMSIAGGTR